MTFPKGREKGSMLLISLGVLTLLALYAITFFAVMTTEKKASESAFLSVTADRVAKTGIERAMIDLKMNLLYKDGIPGNFQQDSWDNLGAIWRYPLASVNSQLPLEKITNINQLSFYSSANGQDGVFQGHAYSGASDNSFGGKDFFRLKVLDCASMIYINNKNRVNLKRMLNLLFTKLGVPNASKFAIDLVKKRPGEGYKTKRQIRVVLGEIASSKSEASKVDLIIQNFITCYSWIDTAQIRPLQAQPPSVEVADPQNLFFEPRAPIDINTAHPAVLYAVIRGIKAGSTVFDESTTNQLVSKIVGIRKTVPFKSWNQIKNWLTLNLASAPHRDLFLANFNPNVNLNKFHPDVNVRVNIDKTDLNIYSTEFCFSSMGFFEITSLGLVAKKDGTILGSSKIQTTSKVFHVHRDTTQNQFEADRKASAARGRHLGIISLPEYSNARQKWVGGDGDLELRPVNTMCNFDGQLLINGLVRKMILTNDFCLGFIRNDVAVGSLSFLFTPNNPYDPDPPTNIGKRPTTENSNGRESVFSPGTSHFFRGSDLLPLGLMIDSSRGAYMRYSGYYMPSKSGTIEFWVKPFKSSASSPEYYFYWGTGSKKAISIYRLGTTLYATFTLGWQNGARSSGWGGTNSSESAGMNRAIGNNPNSSISFDVRGWRAGEWHHVMVTYGKIAYGATVNLRRRRGGGTTVTGRWYASEGRLYVDGTAAPLLMPFSTTANGRTVFPMSFDDSTYTGSNMIRQKLDVEVPKLDKNSNVQKDKDGNVITTVITRVYGPTSDLPYKAGQIYEGGGVIVTAYDPVPVPAGSVPMTSWNTMSFYLGAKPGPSNFANAVMDNIIINHYIHQEIISNRMGGYPSSRYSRPNDPKSPSYGSVFRKRLYALERQDVTLGHIYWTAYPANYGVGKVGYVNAYVDINGTNYLDTKTLTTEQKLGSGYSLEGKKISNGNSDRVYYNVNFDTLSGGTVAPQPQNLSPVLDDLTITYFTTPEILAFYEFN